MWLTWVFTVLYDTVLDEADVASARQVLENLLLAIGEPGGRADGRAPVGDGGQRAVARA